VLLLVLHGYSEQGWHHQNARQTFLLRNSVGENLHVASLKQLAKQTGDNNFSQLNADAISEKLPGHEGFLYWSGARYVWRASAQ
jgi:hypothetical protein